MRSNLCPALLAVALLPTLTYSVTYPACAQNCFTAAVVSAGCAVADTACQCNGIAESEIGESLDSCAGIECQSDVEEGLAVIGLFITQCLNYYSSTLADFASTAGLTPTTSAEAGVVTGKVSSTTEPAAVGASTTVAVNTATVKTDMLPTPTTIHTTEGPSTSTAVQNNGAAATMSTLSDFSSAQNGATDSSSTSSSSSTSHLGLSSGAKGGIGVGVTLGVLAIIGLIVLAFWYGRRSSADKKKKDEAETLPTFVPKPDEGIKFLVEPKPTVSPIVSPISEVEDLEKPLSAEEKAELERRRRAAELQGQLVVPGHELGAGERHELEARRRIARDVYELH